MKLCELLIDIISHRCSHRTQHTIPPISSRNHVRAYLRTCREGERERQVSDLSEAGDHEDEAKQDSFQSWVGS